MALKFYSSVSNEIKLRMGRFFGLISVIIQLLKHWIASPWIPNSKPMGGCKIDSAFHPSLVTKTSGDLMLKSKLSSSSGSAALTQLSPIHKNRLKYFFKAWKSYTGKTSRKGLYVCPQILNKVNHIVFNSCFKAVVTKSLRTRLEY